MKLPACFKVLSPDTDDNKTPYPPSGFLPIAERALGNGDCFGLYWPIGLENSEPIVAEMRHDDWMIVPSFSSADKFIKGDDILDEWLEPTLDDDPASPVALFQYSRQLLKQNKVDEAISTLKGITNVIPEYTDALGLLTLQYRRIKDNDNAIRTAIKAIRAPRSLGYPNDQIHHWLANQKSAPADVAKDPLWKNRDKHSPNYGGRKQNDNYLVLQDMIDEYLDTGSIIEWFQLAQKYSELMYRETVSFQARYEYDPAEYTEQLLEKYEQLTGKTRRSSSIPTDE